VPKIPETRDSDPRVCRVPKQVPRVYRVPTPDGKTIELVRTWTDVQVGSIIASALAVVEQLDPPEDLRAQVFATALNLGGQMAPRQSGVVVAPPFPNPLDNGRH